MSSETIFPITEWKDLLYNLEDHYSVFASLYSVGRPKYSIDIPTAAVYFNRAGNCIDFRTNPVFWAKLTKEEKSFVLSHEALHIFLNHGKRALNVNPREAMLANQALDVVINHTLVDKFRHIRKKVDGANQYCWLDTVFKGDVDVKKAQNYEYYMARLREQRKKEREEKEQDRNGGNGDGQSKSGGQGGELINDHSGLKSFGKKDEKEGEKDEWGNSKEASGDKQFDDLLKRVLDKSQLEDLAEKLAGTETGNLKRILDQISVKPKRKWETVIRDWSLQFREEKEVDQFILTNRRYAMMPRNEVFLPTEAETEASDKRRIEVWFYIDTSGSCAHLAPRLFTAAMSLPKDRFNVRLFCFDTRVYDVDPVKRELSGFGGTSFACIEASIQQKLMYGEKAYPKAVFVLTDGFGDAVSPQFPNRWHWFLSCDYRDYIPKESKAYKLEDFE